VKASIKTNRRNPKGALNDKRTLILVYGPQKRGNLFGLSKRGMMPLFVWWQGSSQIGGIITLSPAGSDGITKDLAAS